MKKMIGGLAAGLVLMSLPVMAADPQTTRFPGAQRAGEWLGQGSRQSYETTREAAQRGYQQSRAWWGEHKDELRDKTAETFRRAGEAGRTATQATGEFFRSFRDGFRRR